MRIRSAVRYNDETEQAPFPQVRALRCEAPERRAPLPGEAGNRETDVETVLKRLGFPPAESRFFN